MNILEKISKLGRQALWLLHRDYLIQKHELNYLFWECTMNCNFRCKHCGSCAGDKVFDNELTTNEIKKAFKDVSENFDAKKVMLAITGGEPLIRQDLFEVMKYASELGFPWGMVTNGFLLNEDVAEKMKQSGMKTIDISIDGLEKTHDEFRNTLGSYQRAIKGLKILQNKNFLDKIRITTSVHSGNINQLEEMYKIFESLGLEDWRLLSVDPIGRSSNENKDVLLNKEELIKLLDFINEKRKKKSAIKLTYGCAHYLGEKYEDDVRDYFFYCRTGINVGSILHNGDMFVCPNVPRTKELIQGNVKQDSFSQVWKNKYQFFRNKDNFKQDICQTCPHWNKCLGGSVHCWDFLNKKQQLCLMQDKLYND